MLLIFSFQFSLYFFRIGRQVAEWRRFDVLYPSDIGRCGKFDKYVSCTHRTLQGNDFELILTVKMETRHPVEGCFGSEFLAICTTVDRRSVGDLGSCQGIKRGRAPKRVYANCSLP